MPLTSEEANLILNEPNRIWGPNRDNKGLSKKEWENKWEQWDKAQDKLFSLIGIEREGKDICIS